MIFNKWYRNNETSKDLDYLKDKFKDNFENADYNNMFSYDLLVFEDKVPACIARLELVAGIFLIVGMGVEKEFEGKEIEDFALRLLIRKSMDLGAQGVFVKPTENKIDFYKNFDFKMANKNFHEANMYYRYGDIDGECCEE